MHFDHGARKAFSRISFHAFLGIDEVVRINFNANAIAPPFRDRDARCSHA